MRKLIQVSFVLSLILIVLSGPRATQAKSLTKAPNSSTASDLIDAVNALRAAHGLSPYQSNSILMGIAQTQAEYILSIQTGTHLDANGLRPYQRALAAGYLVAGDLSQGGWFSENLTGGVELDATGAVEIWMGDAPHQMTMLSATLRDVGAGVAVSGNTYYYVLDCGLSTGGTPVVYTPPAPLHPATATFVPNTPNADGAIIHIIQKGDSLGLISIEYNVPLADILKYNGLVLASRIYAGNKLVIRPAFTATPTFPTSTPTALPTITNWPTATFTPSPLPDTATPTPSPGMPVKAAGGAVGMIIGAALVVAGLITLLGRKPKG